MRVIIAGGRDFNDYELLKQKVDNLLSKSNKYLITIVSGGANGADTLAIKYANENNFMLEVFMAQWGLYGKSAGIKRNKQMAEFRTHLIAFWDGVSHGTKNMIEVAKELNLPTRVIRY